MDDTEILSRCQGLEKMLQDKGFVRPWAFFRVNYLGTKAYFLDVFQDRDGIRTVSETFASDDAEKTFEKAAEWITSCKSVEEEQKEAFLQQLGRVIDSGKKLGVDLTYLKRAMDTLSENLLDKPRPSKVQLDNKGS